MIDLSGLENVNLESLLEVLPAGLVQDAKKLQVCKENIIFSREISNNLEYCRTASATL